MNELEEIQNLYREAKENNFQKLKEELSSYALILQGLKEEKHKKEFDLTEINKTIKDVENKIRRIWSPHITGAERASLDCNGIILQIEPKLDVSVNDRGLAIEWLREAGYEGVMKWDLHTQTLYKIAREHYEKGEEIPGLEFENFQMIKIK